MYIRCWVPTTVACVTLALLIGCEQRHLSRNGVVGAFGGVGLGPGKFHYPRAIAAEPSGCVFIVDKDARIQRFSPEGVFETFWRTPKYAAGKPVGLSVHPDGRLFVADTHYNRVLVYDRDGALLDSFGSEGLGDGQFQLPTDVAFDAEGFIYVGEYNGNDRITKWTADLKFAGIIGDHPINGERLRRPAGLAIDREQTLWVADACNHRIIRFSLDGEVLTTFGTLGDAPGELRYPYDLCVCDDGSLLVCEYGGNRLQWFSPDGRSLRIWGRPGRAHGELFAPWGVTVGAEGRVYVVEAMNNRVQIIEP